MALQVASLNSGSNGNCYYIGNKREAVLIDAGISCRETERRMKRLELSIEKVKAIFITHEHADHINGLLKLVKKHKIPVYITKPTRHHPLLGWCKGTAIHFQAYQTIQIGDLEITPIPKFHDASDPHSFLVSDQSVTVGIFTDSGRVCNDLIKNFKLCHAAFLESNYDEEMLANGDYALHLKNRIRGGLGHLSNKEALQLFLTHRPPFMSHLFLSHLSKNNNTPEIVEALFKSVAGETQIIVAPRNEETELYTIATDQPSLRLKSRIHASDSQLTLF
ncbi:MAG: MBL fold metallo-hydrolase [Cyclobacteriaceae bacterium]|nr:MBL fold metallo-hydrolase [Cyclobacteriaceae bacterium]